MLTLLVSILIASLLGSLHCAGMCGAFVVFAVGGEDSKWKAQTAYHLGRLLTYALLGALAGGLGSLVDVAAKQAQWQPVAAWLAGGLMLGMGLFMLARQWSKWRLPGWKPPAMLSQMLTRGHRLAAGLTPARRALAIGLLTTLLPCGWLWLFALRAAGTGSAAMGALVMAAFWLGTVPIRAALGLGGNKMLGLAGARVAVVGALVVIALGLWMVVQRDQTSMLPWVEQKTRGVESTDVAPVPQDADCPCCKSDGSSAGEQHE